MSMSSQVKKKIFLFLFLVEKVQRPSSKISSLIQDAENKSKQRKSSTENLNLLKRESPLGGEDKKADDLVNAPKLPPKPGKQFFFFFFFEKKNSYFKKGMEFLF